MKTMSTLVTERGQVSIPAEIRKRLSLAPGMRVSWSLSDSGDCVVSVAEAPKPRGARAMLGFGATFCDNRKTTADWMAELREGEKR
jgi:AbrB family looped-hinge helix DNA binding protein